MAATILGILEGGCLSSGCIPFSMDYYVLEKGYKLTLSLLSFENVKYVQGLMLRV